MRYHYLRKHWGLLGFALLLAAWYCPAGGQSPKVSSGELPVPRLDAIKRLDRNTRLTKEEMQTSAFILKTKPHAVGGDAYVVITDHQDGAYLEPLQRLAAHHAGKILKVANLADLPKKPEAFASLEKELRQARAKFVAVAPRLENYRENMLLSLWELFTAIDPDQQVGVFPGILVAPNPQAFAALIDRSIGYRPQIREALRPFVVGQVVDSSANGLRSLQKVGILRNLFDEYGRGTSSLVVRTFRARESGHDHTAVPRQWEVSMSAPRQLIPTIPPAAKQALDEASLLVMFGHGAPGMTCSLDVGAFHDVKMTDKIVLCGSCFSAFPSNSDFPPVALGSDGSEIRKDRERFVMRAIEDGAVVAYGHMRENAGFPYLFPVLEAWLDGLTVGEAYQRLLNAAIAASGLTPGEFVLSEQQAAGPQAARRRNALLYVVIGDPALCPMEHIVAQRTGR